MNWWFKKTTQAVAHKTYLQIFWCDNIFLRAHWVNPDFFFVSLQNSQRMDIPIMDDLLKDINDGCCLATLISFYCPNYLRMSGKKWSVFVV